MGVTKGSNQKGRFSAKTGKKSGRMLDVILGLVGLALIVVLGLATHKTSRKCIMNFSYKTYKKFISRLAMGNRHCWPRRREREDDYYSDY